LQWLCIAGALLPLQGLHLNVLLAQGRSDLFFKLEVIKKALAVIVILITYRYGVLAMIIGQVFFSVLCYALNGYYTTRLLSYSWREQIRDLIPFACLTGLMGAAAFMVGAIPFPNCAVQLFAQVVTGVCIYCLLCWLLRAEMLLEALALLKAKVGFRSGPMPGVPAARAPIA
jgi:O-antigen/teichoic acid export membrane protein